MLEEEGLWFIELEGFSGITEILADSISGVRLLDAL